MMSIPHDEFPDYCFQHNGLSFLARGTGAAAFAALGDSFFHPTLVRYAFMGAETLGAFFPSLAADDRGTFYRDFQAFDWIQSSGLLFPRADAMGLWHDGAEDQLFLKQLDLAVSPVAYASPTIEKFPGNRLAAAVEIVADDSFAIAAGGGFPVRLASCLPTFQLSHTQLNSNGLQILLRAL